MCPYTIILTISRNTICTDHHANRINVVIGESLNFDYTSRSLLRQLIVFLMIKKAGLFRARFVLGTWNKCVPQDSSSGPLAYSVWN